MKLLHTSDWHLGARLGRHDRQADHAVALKGLIAVAEAQQPDVIVHSGDLFDSPRPAYSALELGSRALRRLLEVAPVVVVCGNHDSSQLFRFLHGFAQLAGPGRLRFVHEPEVHQVAEVDGLAIACMPYMQPGAVVPLGALDLSKFEGRYADEVRALQDDLIREAQQRVGGGGVVVYAAHLFVHGARPAKSERRVTVGEDYAVHAEGLHAANYSALGHIHDPQLLPDGLVTGRYAGSLIPIDYGEAIQTKQAVVVTFDRGVPSIAEHTLPGGRPLRSVDGTLDDLLAAAEGGGLDGCLLKARVVSDDPVADLADLVLTRSLDCDVFDIVNEVSRGRVRPARNAGDGAEPTPEELFTEWRAAAGGARQSAPHDDVLDALRRGLASPDPDPWQAGAAARALEHAVAGLAAARPRTAAVTLDPPGTSSASSSATSSTSLVGSTDAS